MNTKDNFPYKPADYENEKASFSYLMGLIAIIIAMPLPIVGLITTVAFYISNRKSTYFVRWHCTQALVLQVTVIIVNLWLFIKVIGVFFYEAEVTNSLIAFFIAAVIFNIIELALTIAAAILSGRGKHFRLFFWGDLTDMICREEL